MRSRDGGPRRRPVAHWRSRQSRARHGRAAQAREDAARDDGVAEQGTRGARADARDDEARARDAARRRWRMPLGRAAAMRDRARTRRED